MVSDFIALKKEASAKEAMETLQKDYFDTEMPFYLYVIGDYGHLKLTDIKFRTVSIKKRSFLRYRYRISL
jgi:Mg/Co/Ni transporter MgtE